MAPTPPSGRGSELLLTSLNPGPTDQEEWPTVCLVEEVLGASSNQPHPFSAVFFLSRSLQASLT